MKVGKPRIAIVGAGIGGLTLGLLLRKHGVVARIYEQAAELREVGAAVALAANGTRVLSRLGLGDALKASSVEPTDVVYRHWATGELIARFPMGPVYTERYGAEFFAIHRASLQRILADSWGRDDLHLNSRIEGLEERYDGIRLHIAGQDPVTADVVVGADGVRSTVRNWVTGGGPALIYSGASGFRGLAPVSALPELPGPMTVGFWLGPGGYVIHYPISADTLNFLAVRPGPMPWQATGWTTEEPPGTALAGVEGWHPVVRNLVASVEQSPRWALFSLPPLRRWTRGGAVLLGDAAHAMLPHQGQGANQAIEDAAVLAPLLAGASRSELGDALRRYEVLRRLRTRQLQRSSRDNAEILGYPDGADAEARNQDLSTLPHRLDWIHGYDVDDLVMDGRPLPFAPPAGHRTSRPRRRTAEAEVLKAGVDLGVFDQIGGGNRQATTVADALGTDHRGTRILLDAMTAIGLLGRHDGYHLTPLAETYLVSGRPSYLGGMVDILAGPWAWEGNPRLAEAVKRGTSLAEQLWETPGHEFWEIFSPSSVGAVAGPGSLALAELIEPWVGTRDSLDILDVACGSGLFSLNLAARHPKARVTLLDSPEVLDLAKEAIERLDLTERTNFIPGDAFEVPLAGSYDLIVVSHLFHHFSRERCAELLSRLAPVLKPDGRLVIHEFVSGAEPAETPFPYLFSVIMLTSTGAGEAHSLETYQQLLRESGFTSPEVHPGWGMPSHFLISERAGSRFRGMPPSTGCAKRENGAGTYATRRS
jgi:salicylate hydroxylase